MRQDKRKQREPVTLDPLEFEAFSFPRVHIARKLFGLKLSSVYLQKFNQLQAHSPTFRSIADTMAETIAQNKFSSFKQWLDYDQGLSSRFSVIMQRHFNSIELPVAACQAPIDIPPNYMFPFGHPPTDKMLAAVREAEAKSPDPFGTRKGNFTGIKTPDMDKTATLAKGQKAVPDKKLVIDQIKTVSVFGPAKAFKPR